MVDWITDLMDYTDFADSNIILQECEFLPEAGTIGSNVCAIGVLALLFNLYHHIKIPSYFCINQTYIRYGQWKI